MNDRVCRDSGRLQNPERLARLEIGRVVGLCLQDAEPPIENVLDVGTGTGAFAATFAEKAAVTGVDIQEAMLAVARVHVPGARFLKGAAEALPFADRSFDLVFLGLVLHETEDMARTLREAHRVGRRRTAVLEWPYEEQPFGPPLADRLKESRVLGLAAEAGFTSTRPIRLTQLVLYLMEHPDPIWASAHRRR
jgi:ubiquinone/menaquinone biosynthesis C-methylase UbiE